MDQFYPWFYSYFPNLSYAVMLSQYKLNKDEKRNEYLEYLELNTLNSYFTLPYQQPFNLEPFESAIVSRDSK